MGKQSSVGQRNSSMFGRGNEERKMLLYDKILERIDEIRSCYAEVVIVDRYDALMMLLDACFVVNFMENGISKTKNNITDWLDCLGLAASISFATRDIMVLENQVPFLVIKLLMSLLYETETILRRFLSWMTSVDIRDEPFVVPEEPPIHLLEACLNVFSMSQGHYIRVSSLSRTPSTSSQTRLTSKPSHFIELYSLRRSFAQH
ncbi:hypothetical protein ACS0TY_003319 [Phlomoides rotata]